MNVTTAALRSVPRVKVTAPASRALHRERLVEVLDGIAQRRVALVVAPAGSGKTTLLAQFAASWRLPVAWYRAEADDSAAETMVQGLAAALSGVFGGVDGRGSVDDLVAAADRWPGECAVLIVDDLHTVAGTEGESVVERFLEHAPPTLRLVLASRCFPAFNLSRLRVSADPIELGPDDLRFRSWEVERLFRDFYGEPLSPEDLAELARRTEGWAAGLQLFHLATRGKSHPERRRILSQLGLQSGMVREYLARNVLDDLPDTMRRFLVGTCVLRRLTGPLCDELLGVTGSAEVLQQLANRQIFTIRVEGGTAFRYHEILRSHLEGVLVAEAGEAEAQRSHRRAGELLQRSGAISEALWAYCRAGDWQAAAHLLGRNGGPVPPGNGAWIDALPAALLEQDPWLVLAKARRFMELGNWPAAIGAYRSAEQRFPSGPGHETCGRERRALALWLEPSPSPRSDWLGLLRAATQGNPLEVAAQARKLPGATGRFTEAVSMLLAGRVSDGQRLLEQTAEMPSVGAVLGAVARLLAITAALISPGDRGVDWDVVVEEVEAAGLSWLAMLLRTTLRLADDPESPAGRRAIDLCASRRDEWGAALLALVSAFVRLCRGKPASQLFDESASRFRQLEAATLERWARAGLALALACEGSPAPSEMLSAGAMGRASGVPGAQVLTLLALALADERRRSHYAALARAAADECAIRWPVELPLGHPQPTTSPAELRCFGGFHLRLNGTALDTKAMKPRARAALHYLALHTGQPLHREHLVDAFWPEVEPHVGIRNLQVVISTLRQLLDAVAGPAGAAQIAREGDAYRLVLPPGATADILRFEADVASYRRARRDGDVDGMMVAAEDALLLYTGDLMPEAGPADWIVNDRERYRREAADASQQLADLCIERRQYEVAVEACERGLVIDRYRDSLWRTLATAYDALGDSASAARARRSYQGVLDELGVGAP